MIRTGQCLREWGPIRIWRSAWAHACHAQVNGDVRTGWHPALLAFDPQAEGNTEPDLQLVWADSNSTDNGRIKLASIIDGNFQQLSRAHRLEAEQAQFSISAAKFRGAWYLAWLGISPHPNVARYTPGELVTYGLKARCDRLTLTCVGTIRRR